MAVPGRGAAQERYRPQQQEGCHPHCMCVSMPCKNRPVENGEEERNAGREGGGTGAVCRESRPRARSPIEGISGMSPVGKSRFEGINGRGG
jgi:hypothetical protein